HCMKLGQGRIGMMLLFDFFFSSRRRHTRSKRDWSSDVCSSDLKRGEKSRISAGFPQFQLSIFTTFQKRCGKRSGRFETRYYKNRSEERRVGKECRSWISQYH